MITKLVSGALIISVVFFGVVAQAGNHLLEMTSPSEPTVETGTELGPMADPGPHRVGIERPETDGSQVRTVVWYPAAGDDGDSTEYSYSYSINMISPRTSTALATFAGTATPNAPPALSDGPFPLVVLSHGFAISPTSYGWLAEHLASHGLVVVAPFHAESLDPGSLWRSSIDRPRDVAAVMGRFEDQAGPGSQVDGLVDPSRVAVVGHSYGGYTAQVAGGARVDAGALHSTCEAARADDPIAFLCEALLPRIDDMALAAGLDDVPTGTWPDWSVDGVDAVVSIAGDAAMFGPAGLAALDVPVLAIGGTGDTDSPFEWGTAYTFEHGSAGRRAEVALEGAGHMIFAGECDGSRRILAVVSMGFCADGPWESDEVQDIVELYVTAFLLTELTADADAADVLTPGATNSPGVAYRAEGY